MEPTKEIFMGIHKRKEATVEEEGTGEKEGKEEEEGMGKEDHQWEYFMEVSLNFQLDV